jgi:hypothetical protein
MTNIMATMVMMVAVTATTGIIDSSTMIPTMAITEVQAQLDC